MSRSTKVAGLVSLLTLCAMVSFGQIPNPGFETWSGGEPVGWITDNSPGFAVPITQTSTRHSGTSAMQGEVVSLFGTPLAPYATSGARGFPVTQRYATLTGWYMFTQVASDSFAVLVVLSSADTAIAGGARRFGPAAAFVQFSVPIYYASSTTPDTGFITMVTTSGDTTGQPHIGSTFIVDDLEFSGIVSVEPTVAGLPSDFSLAQNYPNPFNPTTRIEYSMPSSGHVVLHVYDMLGREVRKLIDEEKSAGIFTVDWDGRDAAGKVVSSGVYLYRMEAAADGGREMYTSNRKMILMK